MWRNNLTWKNATISFGYVVRAGRGRGKSVAELRDSTQFSVPAKLHSECRRVMIETPKLKSEDAEKSQVSLLKYLRKVPGYNGKDLHGQASDLPEHCQDSLQALGAASMADMLSDAAEAKEHMEETLSPADVSIWALSDHASLSPPSSATSFG
mmetsp:Transcript_2752/g.5753  ORF Transcript_2752/g.5753 Transcript_2752/m.5753 type:complete len:153 (+) Transcript_2752:236-694(+)